MLTALRGLLLVTGMAAIPAFAQAECPPQESIDRYAQTARDALVALDGLVPEEQQRRLEDRYAALSILRWSWQGRDAILNETSALDRIETCINSGRCDAEVSERSGAGPRTVARFPSDRLVNWAMRELECAGAADPEPDPDPVEPEIEPETEAVAETESAIEPTPAPEPIEQVVADEPVDTQSEQTTPELEVAETEVSPVDQPATAAPEPVPVSVAEDARDSVTPVPDAAPDETKIAAIPAPRITTSSVALEDTQRLLRIASIRALKGDMSTGMAFTTLACYREAETSDPASICEALFDHYEQLPVRADPIKFLAFTDQLCRLDYARGCANLARYFGVATTAEAHFSAINFYDRACNSGDADACAAASDYYLTGRASVADPERARDTLYRACDLGRQSACQDLAEFYRRGVGGEPNLPLALEMNDVSCPNSRARYAQTCVDAANFVLLNLEEGPERSNRVRTYVQRACEIGHDTGCAWHADNLEFGIGGEVDADGAREARNTACRLGHQASCDARS